MSVTNTVQPDNSTEVPANAKEQRAHDVRYDDEVLDTLPAGESSQGRNSVLRMKINEMFENPENFRNDSGSPRWRKLADYSNSGSASGAKQGLYKHFGKGKDGSGVFLETKRVNGRTILFAKFDPTARTSDFPAPGSVPYTAKPRADKTDKATGNEASDTAKSTSIEGTVQPAKDVQANREKATAPGGGKDVDSQAIKDAGKGSAKG